MHTPQESQGSGNVVQQAQSIADAAQDGTDIVEGPFTITVCDVDLPAFIWDGIVYVQVPLEGFLDAVVAPFSELFRDLEARISEAGRASLSSPDFRASIPRTRVVEPRVVRDSGEQR